MFGKDDIPSLGSMQTNGLLFKSLFWLIPDEVAIVALENERGWTKYRVVERKGLTNAHMIIRACNTINDIYPDELFQFFEQT